jgi:hypothetical protein
LTSKSQLLGSSSTSTRNQVLTQGENSERQATAIEEKRLNGRRFRNRYNPLWRIIIDKRRQR